MLKEKCNLSQLKEWLDRLLIFDPDRWPHREAMGRCMALILAALFLGWKIYRFDDFPQSLAAARLFYGSFESASGQPLHSELAVMCIWGIKFAVWLVESGIYVGYIAAYLTRHRVVAVAKGFMETAFPMIIAGLPLLIALAPYNLPRWMPFWSKNHLPFYTAVMGLILLGGLINLVGLLTLRRAFAIMAEARTMIDHGIYRFVRHPLYLGHLVMFAGSLLLRLHVYTVVLYLVFCIGQIRRAKIEERKLARAFPQYEAYRKRSGMFFPRF